MKYPKAHTIMVAAILTCTSMVNADRLHHIDGTIAEGKILSEGPDEVKIKTKYGELTYQKADLARIERDGDIKAAETTSSVNYARYLPAGPIDPFSPPAMPLLAQLHTTSGTVQQATPPPPAQSGAPAAAPTPTPAQ